MIVSLYHDMCEFICGSCVGLARNIYVRFIYGIFGRKITEYTVIYCVYIRFWPALVL
jgi:hypothetical protein